VVTVSWTMNGRKSAPCQFRRIAAKVGKPFNQSLVQPAANATEEPKVADAAICINVCFLAHRYHSAG
jgi:hypothetical protein